MDSVRWTYDGHQPMVLTMPGGETEPRGDFVVVAPTDSVASPPPNSIPLRVWRKRNLSSDTTAWTEEGLRQGKNNASILLPESRLPDGATVIQAAGGHHNPTYYVADLAWADGTPAPFADRAQDHHLFRSHRASDGVLDGWDCIVPGPATPGVHDGHCTSSTTTAVQRAWFFASDPYNANVVYIVDTNGVKLTVDGGNTWQPVDSLDGWLTEQHKVTPVSRTSPPSTRQSAPTTARTTGRRRRWATSCPPPATSLASHRNVAVLARESRRVSVPSLAEAPGQRCGQA